jgi:hypothetical protein
MLICLIEGRKTAPSPSPSLSLSFRGGGGGERPLLSPLWIHHCYLSQVTEKFYHMLCTSPWSRFELTTLVVIVTDCIGSCKSNYHTITATTTPTSIGVSFPPLILVILICTMTTIYLNNFWTIVMAEILSHHNGRLSSGIALWKYGDQP